MAWSAGTTLSTAGVDWGSVSGSARRRHAPTPRRRAAPDDVTAPLLHALASSTAASSTPALPHTRCAPFVWIPTSKSSPIPVRTGVVGVRPLGPLTWNDAGAAHLVGPDLI